MCVCVCVCVHCSESQKGYHYDVIDVLRHQGSCSMKMEKADILERAVEHLRLLQDTYACGGKCSPMSLVSDQHLMTKKYKLTVE